MVSLHVWFRDGRQRLIDAPTYGAAFDAATKAGAIRAVSGCGEVYRWIDGAWIVLGQPPRPEART